MKAILFGSIGSIVETSEIQRNAFNHAFEAFGLDLHWDQQTYQKLLKASGGRNRIADYAQARGCDVDATAIHKLKTELFQERLWNDGFQFRDGVVDVLNLAAERSMATGFISGTDKQTVDLITTALRAKIRGDLDIVTSRADGHSAKPSPAIYDHAIAALKLDPSYVMAIEDNQSGVDAALAAGVATVSFPGANTPVIERAMLEVNRGVGLTTVVKAILNGTEIKG